jgi:hypothetical protein
LREIGALPAPATTTDQPQQDTLMQPARRTSRLPAMRVFIALMAVMCVALFSGCPQTVAKPKPTPSPTAAE